MLFARELSNRSVLTSFDWSGHQRTSVKAEGSTGGMNAVFRDTLGQPIPNLWRPFVTDFWADDGRHKCSFAFDHQTLTGTLSIQGPGEPAHQVAQLTSTLGLGWTSFDLTACSIRNDRAIAVRRASAGPSDLWMFRLSDGKLVSHRGYDGSELASIVASADGTYIAENSALSFHRQLHAAALSTVLRRVSDWRVVLQLPGQVNVVGFSDDDTRIVTIKEQLPGLFDTELIDRSSGRATWKHDGEGTTVDGFATRPGSGDLALGLRWPGAPSCGVPPCLLDVRLVIVRRDGSATTLPGRYITYW